ncbi:DNA cytosine methyltransferase [Rhodococcus sp. NPDC019627]|uniref:DNA cytosine methyltransferase n=1 Tax=unclassified Rhodococcus (in: high G+C Gram-positive bacteria) TaxID=192944 RepID=UPI0033F3CB60
MTDLFCGAGGSSTGAVQVPGVEVRMAANHWALAVETHNTNHPDADHACADLSQVDPRLFPRTDILWASPECTNHSVAKGVKRADTQPDLFGEVLPADAAERSRATMWDVVRFAEHHKYRAVLVENVVDAWHWPPFQAWLMAMHSVGYEHQLVFLNSMHAQAEGLPAAQSRDRMYVSFWRKGDRKPDMEAMQRPTAHCDVCGEVRAMQAFKNPDKRWGRYRAQYLYRCPNVACRNQVLEPDWLPASSIIDWTLEGKRIGDRAKPLAEKTLARIQKGMDRYWGPLMVPVEGRDGKEAAPADRPLRTQTTRNETGVAIAPFIAELRGGGSTARPVSDPLCTVTASGTHHGLVVPYYGNGTARPMGRELPTVTTVDTHALALQGKSVSIDDVTFRMLEPHEIKSAMAFPAEYVIKGNKREQVRMSGNAVTPPAARDLIAAVTRSLGVAA